MFLHKVTYMELPAIPELACVTKLGLYIDNCKQKNHIKVTQTALK